MVYFSETYKINKHQNQHQNNMTGLWIVILIDLLFCMTYRPPLYKITLDSSFVHCKQCDFSSVVKHWHLNKTKAQQMKPAVQ